MRVSGSKYIKTFSLLLLLGILLWYGADARAAKVPRVRSLKLYQVDGTTMKLKWTKIKTCSGYMIYRYDKSTNRYKVLHKIKGANISTWTDTNTNTNFEQRYAVAAYRLSGKKTTTGKTRKARWGGCLRSSYIAHRGAMDLYPDGGSMAAFQAAKYTEGYQTFECDLWYTDSGDLLISHDYNLKEKTGADLLITQLTWQTRKLYPIQNIDYGSYGTQYIPTLEEVVSWCSYTGMNLYLHLWPGSSEMPTAGIAKTVKLLRKYNMINKTFVLSVNVGTLSKFQKYKITTGYLSRATTASTIKQAASIAAGHKFQFMIFPYRNNSGAISKSLIRACHKNGVKVYIYNILSPAVVSTMMNKGLDGWISNKPVFVN